MAAERKHAKNMLLYTMNDGRCLEQIFSTCAIYQMARGLGWDPVVYDEFAKEDTRGLDYVRRHCCMFSEMCLHSDREEYLRSFDIVITGGEKKWKCADGESVEKCFLDWGRPKTGRIAYAPTFGEGCSLPLGPKNAAYFLLRKFQGIAVADSDTQRILNQEFQVDTERVCSPILLADHFVHEDVKEIEGLFIFAFFEERDGQKQKVTGMAEETLRYRVLDYSEEAKAHKNVTMDEYLNAIEKSSLVVTDSVAVTYLAILYKKPFIAVLSRHEDGRLGRFSALEQLGLMERAICVQEDVLEKRYLCRKPIRYGTVDYRLAKWRESSIGWLQSCLNRRETDE